MNFYFAPMEGVTGYIYRNAHNNFFKGIDKYYSPFIVPNQSVSFKSKDINDILPKNNQGLVLIPQLLTNNAKDFINTSMKIKELGYQEINLNLGCPSGTVVSKGRGSGFLAKREELGAFLDEIFAASVTSISIKTRIGKDDPEEFYELIELYNRYPIKELTIHPRIQKDFYRNVPNLKVFKDALALSRNPVCYNGDICTLYDYKKFVEDFPDVESIMIGRGLLTNPGLINELTNTGKVEKSVLREFHDRLLEDYSKVLSGDRNILFRMKELWFYMNTIFIDSTKYMKKIRKSERLIDYICAVDSLFYEQDIWI
ncbi:MAG TPA: tRNA-dihydrouridine synthase family protein [Lachnospiraceae bacterium]|nr:tRNA-dihydrouridine synthase family protein [Lachnospiraceae bacterium]